MEAELGRFFEAHGYETKMLLRTVLDLAEGQGAEVVTSVEGRELVFRRGEGGRGFLRVLPQAVGLVLGFPRGGELFDPKSFLKGPSGFQKSVRILDAADLDPYLRRMLGEAYGLDG